MDSAAATQYVLDAGTSSASAAAVLRPALVPFSLAVKVSFGNKGIGSGADLAKTTVAGLPFITAAQSRFASPLVVREDSDDNEDALIDNVRASIVNIVDGVGFDVVAHAPEGTNGTFVVHILGV